MMESGFSVPSLILDAKPAAGIQMEQYARAFIQHNEAIILEAIDDQITVGLCALNDAALRERIIHYHQLHDPGKVVRFVALEKNDLFLFLGKASRDDLATLGKDQESLDGDSVYLDRIANDAPIVNLVNSSVLQAYNDGASDLHFDPRPEHTSLRFRIDGVLQEIETYPRHLHRALCSRVKVMAQLNIMERRLPQDGRCTVTVADKTLDLRVSILPGAWGESVVIRLLHNEKTGKSLDDLGFEKPDILRLQNILLQPHGLFLATGPTGSGKTTTLHAMIRELPLAEMKVVTLEDPVEYLIPEVLQVQVNEDIGLGFENTLRRILRHDPDVIMVGEIRDYETANLAIRAALTGHLVVSSLHTNSATESIHRIINLGVEPYLLANVLRGALGQRLVRKLCPRCSLLRQPGEYQASDWEIFGSGLQERFPLREAVGCEQCHNLGYQGRTLLYELITPDEHLKSSIVDDHTHLRSQDYFAQRGLRTMQGHALHLLKSGVTSYAELRRALYL